VLTPAGSAGYSGGVHACDVLGSAALVLAGGVVILARLDWRAALRAQA
jgi:hypothetical protein